MASDDNKTGGPPGLPQNDSARQEIGEVQTRAVNELRQLSFQYMQDGFLIADKNGLLVDANTAFCQMTGFSREELIDSGPQHSFWPPEELEHLQAAFARIFQGDFSEVELAFMRKSGERFPVLVNPFAIRDDNGTTTFYAATVKDITTRVSMEAALQAGEDRYRALFENSSEAIIIVEEGKITDCNQRALELFGIASRDRITLRSASEFLPATQPGGQDSSTFVLERMKEAYPGEARSFEWTQVKADGTSINTEVSLSTFNLGDKRCVQAIIRDITQRRKMEDALRDSEVRFRTLFENAGDAILIMDDDHIVDCNKRTQELFGHSLDTILSVPTSDFFPPTQPNGRSSIEFYSEMVDATRSGNPQFFEWTGLHFDGTIIHTEVTLTSFTLGGKHYTQSIVRDITLRKQMEEALIEFNTALEDRVKQRTDDLEKAGSELLQRNIHLQEMAKRLRQAEDQERKRIARLLHDNHQQLLVAAKIRVEMLQSDSYASDVNKVAHKVLEILDQAVEVTRSLTMELAPPILYGTELVVAMQWLARWMEEEHQLEVVVLGSLPSTRISSDVSDVLVRGVRELLFNVIKHSGVRQARVNITVAGQQLLVIVSDDGAGFNVADTLESAGSYGLFSIQEQLTSLDGRLDISSDPQRGTRCTLSIPMAMAEVSNSAASPAVNSITTETTITPQTLRGPIRILVADDNSTARHALVEILTMSEDFDIVGEAVDGLDAVEKTRTLMPEVILMDVTMPLLDGVEATRAITTEFSGVKVIGLSMHSSEEMQARMLAAGAASYLQKLTPADELFATIHDVMNKDVAGEH